MDRLLAAVGCRLSGPLHVRSADWFDVCMTEPIRWGILATGGIATVRQDLGLVDDARSSRSPPAASNRPAGSPPSTASPAPYGTWEALADDPDVDIVYVATPHIAHYAAAKMMLEAGKAVLCEKPFTLTAAAGRRPGRRRGRAPRVPRRGDVDADDPGDTPGRSSWSRRRDRRGRPRCAPTSASRPPVEPEHRLRNPDLGGGALLDLGVYPVALAQLFLGAPDAVSATARLTPEGVDETTGVLLGYACRPDAPHGAPTRRTRL